MAEGVHGLPTTAQPPSLTTLSDYVVGWVHGVVQGGATVVDLALDALKAPSRFGQAARILTGDGATGSVYQVLLPFALLLLGAIGVGCLAYLALARERRKLRLVTPPCVLLFALALLRAAIVDAMPWPLSQRPRRPAALFCFSIAA